MAERKEERTPLLTNTHIHIGSWIPSTPAKLHLTTQQLICDKWQENHLVQVNSSITERSTQANHVNRPNCSELGRLSGDYLQGMQCQLAPACSEEDLCTFGGISVKDAAKWTTPFGNLLAPANVAGTTMAGSAVSQNDFMTTRSLSALHFYTRSEGKCLKMSEGNTSVDDLDSLLGPKFMTESNSIADALKADGTSSPSRILLDLNSSPIMIEDTAFFKSKSGQFECITPEKTDKVYMRESVVLNSNTDEVSVEKDSQENTISRDEVRQLRKKVKYSKLVVDRFCATTSSQLQENHKPDKGDNKEANLTKTHSKDQGGESTGPKS